MTAAHGSILALVALAFVGNAILDDLEVHTEGGEAWLFPLIDRALGNDPSRFKKK